jgi:hypothetical protein
MPPRSGQTITSAVMRCWRQRVELPTQGIGLFEQRSGRVWKAISCVPSSIPAAPGALGQVREARPRIAAKWRCLGVAGDVLCWPALSPIEQCHGSRDALAWASQRSDEAPGYQPWRAAAGLVHAYRRSSGCARDLLRRLRARGSWCSWGVAATKAASKLRLN